MIFKEKNDLREGNISKNLEKVDKLIDWCLIPTLAVFQQYLGIKKFYQSIS